MIDYHTMKFGPAVNQKELGKRLNGMTDPAVLTEPHKKRTRIELVGDSGDLKNPQSY